MVPTLKPPSPKSLGAGAAGAGTVLELGAGVGTAREEKKPRLVCTLSVYTYMFIHIIHICYV